MALRERIDELRPRLSPADGAVLEVLLSHPTEAAFLPADQVAERAGVHAAAATRLARKLGYTGYPQLRTAFQAELLGGPDAAERVRRRVDRSDGDLLASLVDDEITALRALPRAVPAERLDEAAAALLAARRVLVFARGNATVLGSLLVRRLRRGGLPAVELPGADRDLAEELVGLDAADVVFALAFRRPPRSLAPLLATAAEVGAPVVLLTDVLGPDVRDAAGGRGRTASPTAADVEDTPRPAADGAGPPPPDPAVTVLSAPRGSGREFQSLTAPMAVANALVLTLARQAPERTTAALQRLDLLLERFDA